MQPGHVRDGQVRIGIVGVGNCASSLGQGLSHYRDATANALPPGLMSSDAGGYRVSDIAVASAFDVSAAKVGRDIEVEPSGRRVQRGLTVEALGDAARGRLMRFIDGRG